MAIEYVADLAEDQLVIDMSEDIAELDPDAGPLTVLLKKLSSRDCYSNKIEWMDSAQPVLQDVITDSVAVNANSVGVTNAERFHANDIILIPQYGYKGVVTAVVFDAGTAGEGDLTVTRITDGSDISEAGENILVIGNAYLEGANKSTPRQEADVQAYNHTQIFKDGFGLSKTEMAVKKYGGERLAKITVEKEIEHLKKIDRALWLGDRSTLPGSATNYGTLGGVIQFLTAGSAKTKSVAVLTETAWNDWLRDLFEYHQSKPRYIFSAGLILQAINTWGAGKLELLPKDRTYGITINQYRCAFGEVYLINNRRVFNALAAPTKAGYEGYAVALILDNLTLRPLKGRNTKLFTNLQTPGADKREDEFLTELSLEVRLPKTAGILSDVTAIG